MKSSRININEVSMDNHKKMIDIVNNSNNILSRYKCDNDVLRENHEFIRDDEKDSRNLSSSWEIRMARNYYNQLYKEYALGDLTRYKEGKIGLRWRTQNEVMRFEIFIFFCI